MKRLMATLLALALACSFTACNDDEDSSKTGLDILDSLTITDETSKPDSSSSTETTKPDNSSSTETTTPDDNSEKSNDSSALDIALDCLSEDAYSYNGLIDVLKKRGISAAEAKNAADRCGANWDDQAKKMAEGYLDSIPMSKQELIEQLEFEGFSLQVSTATVNGMTTVDWKEQAKLKAEDLLTRKQYTKQEMIEKLIDSMMFTQEEAEYGATATGLK